MKNLIIECAKRYDADLVGFAPASRFDKDDPIFKILPETFSFIIITPIFTRLYNTYHKNLIGKWRRNICKSIYINAFTNYLQITY